MQLAETLGVSQQIITTYEVGRRRIQVSALPVIAHTVEALVAEAPRPTKRGPAPKLQPQLELIATLPGQFHDRHAGVGLLDESDDLFRGETTFLHVRPLGLTDFTASCGTDQWGQVTREKAFFAPQVKRQK